MKTKNYILLLLFGASFLCPLNIHAQRNLEKGNRYFGLNQYEKAIPFLKKGIKEGGADREAKMEATYRLADCYRLLGDFTNAEEIYKQLVRRGGAEALFQYGSALKAGAKYAEAKKVFLKYVKKNPRDPKGPMMVESCDIAQQMLDADWGYTARELSNINTPDEDISPIFYKGGIVFSSQRPGGLKPVVSFDGGGTEILLDLYYMDFDGTEKSTENKAYFFPGLNTAMHEGPACFTEDGKTVYYTTTVKGKRMTKSADVVQNTLQIFVSNLEGNSEWTEGVSAFPFNAHKYSVMHPSISADGKKMVFASDMPGGLGGTDIYLIYRRKDGTWTEPFNLGPEVNTSANELFPFYNNYGKIYFSSNGHAGMGKLDIFQTQFDPYIGWTLVENMGVPINSIGDDICFSEIENTGRGLFVSDRINGTGKSDIYGYAKLQPIEIEVDEQKIWVKNNSAFDALTYSIREEATKEDLELAMDRGYYSFTPDTGKEYRLSVRKDGFSYNKIYFSISYNKHGNRAIKIKPRKGDVKVKLFAGKLVEPEVTDSLIVANLRASQVVSKKKRKSLIDRLRIAMIGETTEEYDLATLLNYRPENIHQNMALESGVEIKHTIGTEIISEQETNEDGLAFFIAKSKAQNTLTLMRNFEGKKVSFPIDEYKIEPIELSTKD